MLFYFYQSDIYNLMFGFPGFGLTAPITLSGQVCFLVYALLGIPLNILLFNTLLDQTVNIFTCALCWINRCWRKRRRLVNLTNQGEPWEATTVTIAITCFMVVIVIILLSAPLFVYLDDWSFFESIYFLVVAFTTVGFGDFVPGGLHTSSGENLTPHYRVGNWFVIIVGTIFMYTAMALMASMYKQCLEYMLDKYQKYFKKKKTNQITASPPAPSTPVTQRGQSIAVSPLRDERKREMAARALQNWRAAKKPNMVGLVNQVEESILKTRRTASTDDRAPGFDGFHFLPLADLSRRPSQTIRAQTNADDLTTLEAKLTKEFNQLLKEIERRRESLLKKPIANEERGIDNGVVIAVSSGSESTASPPPCDDAGSGSTLLTLNIIEPQQ